MSFLSQQRGALSRPKIAGDNGLYHATVNSCRSSRSFFHKYKVHTRRVDTRRAAACQACLSCLTGRSPVRKEGNRALLNQIFKSLHAETADIDLAFTVDDLLRQCLPDRRRVLESMA